MRRIEKMVSRSIRTAALAFLLLASAQPMLARMNYRDASEVETTLRNLARNSNHARLYTVGLSNSWKQVVAYGDWRQKYSYWVNENYYIYAIRISADTSISNQDHSDRNSILFEAGMHPREWLTTESCLALAEYLVAHAEDEGSRVPELLSKTDVWIIPLTTVAGRVRDDMFGGDPTLFSTYPSEAGWRGSGDTRDCEYGTNVARNFSSGWSNALAACGSDYRGFAPFASLEAAALRRFVQNHSISMAVIIHSNSEKGSNLWRANDVAGNAIIGLARWLWASTVADPALALDASVALGSGLGQFSAWLSQPSDTPGEPDQNTSRAIQTIFLELPFLSENYRAPYRNAADDGSNGFHPSGDAVNDLIQLSFIPTAKFLISHAATPGCNALYGCPNRDFGLVGAKIASGSEFSGVLETAPASRNGAVITPARDYIPTGRYRVWYRVQNFSSDVVNNRLADVKVTIQANGAAASQIGTILLDSDRAAGTGFADLNIAQPNVDYTVTIEVRPTGGFAAGNRDDFSQNDKKVFKFRSYALQ